MAKLYSLLFEAPLNTDTLALVRIEDKFILYDTKVLLDILTKFKTSKKVATTAATMQAVAAYVSTIQPIQSTGECSGAWSVGYSARNPAYRGAGILTVKLASAVLGVPLTSDRNSSSSPEAKAMWANVEKDSTFKRTELDNFYNSNRPDYKLKKNYVDVDGHTTTDRAGPRTPQASDDCLVPDKNKLGTGSAFQSSIDPTPFLERHREAMKVAETKLGRHPGSTDWLLASAGSAWFNKLYGMD